MIDLILKIIGALLAVVGLAYIIFIVAFVLNAEHKQRKLNKEFNKKGDAL